MISKNPYRIDILELKEHEAVTASVELEYCFSYGTFGYGYSSIVNFHLCILWSFSINIYSSLNKVV